MAFPLQQLLQKRTSVLRCKYVTKTFKFYGEGILDLEFYCIFLLNFRLEHFPPQRKNIMGRSYGLGPNYKIYESQTSVLFMPKFISFPFSPL